MARIIVVEDDIEQQEELLCFLSHAGHEALAASDGLTLDRCLLKFTPDIVLLDYNLPGENGLGLIIRLRERLGHAVGLVMVTARSMSIDRVGCRRAGADDYLVKPVDFDELLVLIDNLILRLNPPAPSGAAWKLLLACAELVPPNAPPVSLTAMELLLLQTLADTPNRWADRDALVRGLGKKPFAYDPRALEANISRLRRKLPLLEDGRNPIQAMRGMGYKFIRPLTVVA